MADDAVLMTTAELAQELHRAPETLVRWRRLRIGPPWVSLHGRVLYERRAFAQWIAEQQVTPNRESAG